MFLTHFLLPASHGKREQDLTNLIDPRRGRDCDSQNVPVPPGLEFGADGLGAGGCGPMSSRHGGRMSRPCKVPQIQSQGVPLGSQILHESQMHTSFRLAEGPQEVMRFDVTLNM